MGVYNCNPKASHCKAYTDRTRIFYSTCEKEQQIECKVFFCDSVIGPAYENVICPTGESARDNSRTINNL